MIPGFTNQQQLEWIRPPLEDAIYLTGPTASGKSSMAIELATRTNAEILSVDSMAVYRGMDIGTAKPSSAQRDAVPHHLIDLVDATQAFTVAQFQIAYQHAVDDITSRGGRALLVGGTGL